VVALVLLWRLLNGIVMEQYYYYYQPPESVGYIGRACGLAKAQTDFGCVEAAIWIGGRLGMLRRHPE
jgi:hypothetical protein